MMKQSRLKLVQNYVRNKTDEILKSGFIDNNGIEASSISYDLKIDRANTSRILNSLWNEGNLIKIAGRPVLFLDYHLIVQRYQKKYIPTYIPLNDKLSSYLDVTIESPYLKERNNISIQNIIGANGSLKSEIDKAKAAVSYPPFGLHTIISGSPGTGKKNLVLSMLNYAINTGNKNKKYSHYEIDCRTYYDNSSGLETILFGDCLPNEKNRNGLIQKASGGFIILEHIEFLPQSFIELLGTIISSNIYISRKNGEPVPIECMFIITTTLPLNDSRINDSLVRYFPITIHLNDIDYRGTYEKMELILDVFSKEAARIGIPIKLSKDVLLCLTAKKYKHNITELTNEVKSVCSKAYMDSIETYSKQISIGLFHLPSNYLEMSQQETNGSLSNAEMLLKIMPGEHILFDSTGFSESFSLFREFPSKSATHLLSQFVDEFNIDVDSLTSIENYVNENINCLKNCGDIQLKTLRNNIDPFVLNTVINTVTQIPRYQKLRMHEELLYGILLHITNAIKRMSGKTIKVDETSYLTDKMYPQEYELAEKIFKNLQNKYNFTASKKEVDFLASYLAITNQYVNKQSVGILVIAHGQSTATDMVNYIKATCSGQYYIDAIDFNNKMQLNDCIELACLRASSLNQGSGVLIVCDMEPLTTIGETVIRNCGISCKTIHPLSLNTLIQLVKKSTSPIQDIDSLTLQNNNSSNYLFIDDDHDAFIHNLAEKVISKTCIFIDCNKAVNVLSNCLKNIISSLNIQETNDITVKFICHSVAMLERVIKNESWQNSKVKPFIKKHPHLMHIIEQSFEFANNTYGIKIPQTELVYIGEIFEPYLTNA